MLNQLIKKAGDYKFMKKYLGLIGLLFFIAGCVVSNGAKSRNKTVDSNRINTYQTISTNLALLSNHDLGKLIEQEASSHLGVGGGATGFFEIDNTRVFYKKINLTDLERRPENVMSTKNIFDLPLYYQYGIGSAGFGAWRELSAHIMTTNWVLTGACPNFPLLYHWHVLPRQPKAFTAEDSKRLDEIVEYWGGSPAIRTRLEAIQNASASIVLFLEYIPNMLAQWLEKKLTEGDAVAKESVTMVEKEIKTVTSFMQAHDLIHFDAHFGNILTDGHRLYFTDFGLALSSQFELSEAELNFFNAHRNYDRYETTTKLVLMIITSLFGKEQRETILHEYATGKGESIIAPWASTVVTRYAPMTEVINNFYQKLRKGKSTPFPFKEVEQVDTDGKKS